MTLEQKQIKIAEALGHTDIRMEYRYNGIHDVEVLCGEKGGIRYQIEDYFGDLNVMRAVRETLLTTEDEQTRFISELAQIALDPFKGIDECIYELLNTKAEQQAEALGKTLKLWE